MKVFQPLQFFTSVVKCMLHYEIMDVQPMWTVDAGSLVMLPIRRKKWTIKSLNKLFFASLMLFKMQKPKKKSSKLISNYNWIQLLTMWKADTNWEKQQHKLSTCRTTMHKKIISNCWRKGGWMREMCWTKGAYFNITVKNQPGMSFTSSCPAVSEWHWYKSLCQEREGRLNWRRNGRSKFKAGLWEVVLFDPSLPGQLLSISLHSGHAVSTKQGGYCTDVQALLG